MHYYKPNDALKFHEI